VIDKQ